MSFSDLWIQGSTHQLKTHITQPSYQLTLQSSLNLLETDFAPYKGGIKYVYTWNLYIILSINSSIITVTKHSRYIRQTHYK